MGEKKRKKKNDGGAESSRGYACSLRRGKCAVEIEGSRWCGAMETIGQPERGHHGISMDTLAQKTDCSPSHLFAFVILLSFFLFAVLKSRKDGLLT